MMTELIPQYSSRKSFYRKAMVSYEDVKINKRDITLYSYGTKVAVVKIGYEAQPIAIVYGTYNTTTSSHIKEFLLQHDFKAENKKQILKDYGGEDL